MLWISTTTGRTDLIVSNDATTSATSCAFVSGAVASAFESRYGGRNAIVGKGTSWRFLSALPAGVPIGAANISFGNMAVRKPNGCNHTTAFTGPWANGGKGVKNRNLGLKFYFKKQAHYGWLRFNVVVHRQHYPAFQVTLTGYAYETIPNKPIIAGREHGKDDATLGRLAQGASGVSNGGKQWKRPDRTPAPLSDSLHRQLNGYALSACAAGVGALALTQSAGARIVYTPTNVTISRSLILCHT